LAPALTFLLLRLTTTGPLCGSQQSSVTQATIKMSTQAIKAPKPSRIHSVACDAGRISPSSRREG